jgi:CheY-like chemotaxis protein
VETRTELEISLRQFCRLLLADWLFGDEIARIAASNLPVQGPISEMRVRAFRGMLKLWREAYESQVPPRPFTDASLLTSLGPPPPDEQTALLLFDVMEFDAAEVEAILGPVTAPAMQLVMDGRAQYADKADGAVVIVEDEPAIAFDLQLIVEGLGASVAAMAANAEDGVKLILKHKPKTVLLDYNLDGGGTGIDVFNNIREDHDCTVVFVTAFPRELLTGEGAEPDIVITKPYSELCMRAVIAHALSVSQSEKLND